MRSFINYTICLLNESKDPILIRLSVWRPLDDLGTGSIEAAIYIQNKTGKDRFDQITSIPIVHEVPALIGASMVGPLNQIGAIRRGSSIDIKDQTAVDSSNHSAVHRILNQELLIGSAVFIPLNQLSTRCREAPVDIQEHAAGSGLHRIDPILKHGDGRTGRRGPDRYETEDILAAVVDLCCCKSRSGRRIGASKVQPVSRRNILEVKLACSAFVEVPMLVAAVMVRPLQSDIVDNILVQNLQAMDELQGIAIIPVFGDSKSGIGRKLLCVLDDLSAILIIDTGHVQIEPAVIVADLIVSIGQICLQYRIVPWHIIRCRKRITRYQSASGVVGDYGCIAVDRHSRTIRKLITGSCRQGHAAGIDRAVTERIVVWRPADGSNADVGRAGNC